MGYFTCCTQRISGSSSFVLFDQALISVVNQGETGEPGVTGKVGKHGPEVSDAVFLVDDTFEQKKNYFCLPFFRDNVVPSCNLYLARLLELTSTLRANFSAGKQTEFIIIDCLKAFDQMLPVKLDYYGLGILPFRG